ncbi:hypothetical protein KX816_05310 [Sphingosinicellaceae bacterium]|nr:hypothetical protein KX816_05310 [Sphingosinicellaceae bacterium]
MIVDGMRVRVAFGAHVFAMECKIGDPADLRFMDGKTPRTFCPIRYSHSQELPKSINDASGGDIYKKGVNLVLKLAEPNGPGVYHVAFIARKSNSPKYDVKLQVLSAHVRPSAVFMPKASFCDVIRCTAEGQVIDWKKK